jgi:hypothetical protein
MPDAGSASPLRLSRSLAPDSGANAIEVYNSANLIASLPARASSSCQAIDIRRRFSSIAYSFD